MATHVLRLGLILSLSLLWFFANTVETSACSCLYASSSDAWENSTSVFSGRVIGFKEVIGGSYPGSGSVVVFDVSTVWKGPRYETMYIRSTGHEYTCGFNKFGEYQRFNTKLILYVYEEFSVSLCSRIIPLDKAQEDMDLLGEGHKPKPGTKGPIPGTPEFPPQQSTDIEWVEPMSGGCGLGSTTPDAAWLGIMAGLVWTGVRRRPRR